MSNARRTKSGCWTCRLRRKKCDEEGLPCSNCSTRGLFCHGYGLKPSWKDRGEQEKEEASRLQMRSRVRRKSRSSTINATADDNGQQFALDFASLLDMDTPTQPPPPPTCSTNLSVATITPTSDRPEFDFLDSLNLQADVSWTMDLDPIWVNPSTFDATSELQVDSPTPRGLVTIENHGQRCVSLTALCHPLPPESDAGKRATELVMHFLGETFPLQHRLCQGSPLTHRSWVLSLLMRSPTFCSASLSMSALHFFNTLSIGNEARAVAFRDYHEYRSSALRGLKDLMDSTSMTSVLMYEPTLIESLICSVQVALLEAFGKNMQDCQSHLKVAVRYLIQQSEVLPGNQPFPSKTPTTYAQLIHSSGSRDVASLGPKPSMERQAHDFFRSLLIWNDVLHSSAQRQVTDAKEVYSNLLQDECFAAVFRETMTCEAWVFSSILEATSLGTWKCEQEAQGVLSIRELVNRGQKIESLVEEKLSELLNILNGEQTDMSKCRSRVYTSLFAHALLIHLHTIVSGPWPELPEIISSIDRAVTAWQLLPSMIDLKTLAWPFSVTASLATGSKRDWFRKVASDFRPENSMTGNLIPWSSVLEECWKGFDDRDSERNVSRCDWRIICQKLSLSLLFV